MSIRSPFYISCSEHLTNIRKAFEARGEKARIQTTEKKLIQLFDQKIKEIEASDRSSIRKQKKHFTALKADMESLNENMQKLSSEFSSNSRAQSFTSAILGKITLLAELLNVPSKKAAPAPVSSAPAPASSTCTTPELQETLKKRAAKDLEIRPEDLIEFDRDAAKEQGIQGFENRGGNDCFQNALCQALLAKKFIKNLINRLPDILRRHFYRKDGIHSQQLRNSIRHSTAFQHSLHSQEDPHELFVALCDVTDQAIPLTLPPALPLQSLSSEPRKIDQFQTFIEKRNIVFKVLLYSLFIPLKIFYLIWTKVSSLLSNEQEELLEEPLPLPVELPPKTAKEEPNDLKFSLYHTRRWDVTDVPEAFKNDPKFGGENNLSTKSDSADENPAKRCYQNHLQITLTPEQEAFDLQLMVDHLFSNDIVSTSDRDPTVQAPMREQSQFESIPGALVLQVKRFETLAETDAEGNFVRNEKGDVQIKSFKKFNPAENFNPMLTLSPEHFTENIRPQSPVTMQLQSFIVHKGSEARSGHYVAFRKVDDAWYYFDDSRCQKITEEAAMRAASHAYMYFFETD